MVRDCTGLRGSRLSPQLLPVAAGSQQEPEDGEGNKQGKEREFGSGTALKVTRCRKMTLFLNNLLNFINTSVTVWTCCFN